MTDAPPQTLAVDRAVFASTDRSLVKGYQLVARSAGIDRPSAQALCRWAPTRMLHDAPQQWTAQAFQLPDGRHCLARTLIAGREYSQRGGVHVVTIFLVLTPWQYSHYHDHPVAVIRIALALGYLHVTQPLPHGTLPQCLLPAYLPMPQAGWNEPDAGIDTTAGRWLDEASQRIASRQRIAVISPAGPLAIAAAIVNRLPAAARQSFSFSGGLPLSVHRPFQLHCLKPGDFGDQRALLDSQSIRCLHGEPEEVAQNGLVAIG